MAKYKLTKSGVQDKKTGAFIPDCQGNRDWRKYQTWLKKKGNKPDPEFTKAELETQEQRKTREIENAVVDMRLRKDAAKAEGLTELEEEYGTELTRLKSELADRSK